MTEKPYNKAVDLWSVGVIAYLLLSGSLPFNHEDNEREIARQTVHDPVVFIPQIWKNITSDAKNFVESNINLFRNFFQYLCLLGYCLFPLNIAAVIIRLVDMPAFVKLIVVSIMLIWSCICNIFLIQLPLDS